MSARRTKTRVLATAGVALLLTFFIGQARAQFPCGAPQVNGPPYSTEVWVDPINGSDTGGQLNNPASPFQTITAAMLALPAGGPTSRNLVHLNPGIYSRTTNLETFPIGMQDWTDIQGVGAKQVVLRGDQTQAPFNTFYPLSDAGCQCGTRQFREILVDFSFLLETSYAEMLDGVTLQGGHIQVYSEAEYGEDLEARVSNCVFDMLDGHVHDGTGSPVAGPDFGVLVVQRYQNEFGYLAARMHVLNNTFIQTWHPYPAFSAPLFTAVPGSVAICNVNDPDCVSGNGDPNQTLRGIGRLNVQNNLIRSFGPVPATAMLGLDAGDTSAAFGTRTGPTNAFDPSAVGGFNGTYCSQVLLSLPSPRFNPNPATGGTDPGFAGEWLTSQPTVAVPLSHARDWRLLPDSACVDQGSGPLQNLTGLLELRAGNGTAWIDSLCTASSSFDFDGEVYGNRRVMPGPTVDVTTTTAANTHPDIGFDEVELLVDCGTVNDTNVHTVDSLPFLGGNVPGTGMHVLIYPTDPMAVTPDSHRLLAVDTLLPGPAYTIFPGGAIPPTDLSALGLTPPFQWLWLVQAAATTLIPPSNLTRVTFTSLYDGTAHALSYATFAANPSGPSHFYRAEQARYKPAGGVNAGRKMLSNLQPVYD